MTPHPLLDYSTEESRRELADILTGIIPSAGTVNSTKS
jgi:hypothetical protein